LEREHEMRLHKFKVAFLIANSREKAIQESKDRLFGFFKAKKRQGFFPNIVECKSTYTRAIKNDYHSKNTAGGYTRNETGKPFYS